MTPVHENLETTILTLVKTDVLLHVGRECHVLRVLQGNWFADNARTFKYFSPLDAATVQLL